MTLRLPLITLAVGERRKKTEAFDLNLIFSLNYEAEGLSLLMLMSVTAQLKTVPSGASLGFISLTLSGDLERSYR